MQLERLDNLVSMLELCTLKRIEGGADWTRRLTGKTKDYASQSTKTLLEDLFEMNLPSILDPGHTTASLTPDQMMQFARVVRLEVTLASFDLLEEIKL